ncbi:hypothetical protein [Paenibacillus elgii]|uniref:hypothetical protein n=1 Tax=Paenibacillus elgii TaxID=189691 RepID=UPI000248D401|nr:hypothetical protein [Paenibacillus elgii]
MNYPKELIVKMKEVEFIYDTSIGKVLNGNYVDSKHYVDLSPQRLKKIEKRKVICI